MINWVKIVSQNLLEKKNEAVTVGKEEHKAEIRSLREEMAGKEQVIM